MKREEDVDRQEKTQTSIIQTHTHTSRALSPTSHYLKEISMSTLVSISQHAFWEQFPVKCCFIFMMLGRKREWEEKNAGFSNNDLFFDRDIFSLE